ncbi:MAG: peptidoglycan -binding protein [Reyranellaceae bacterium]
MAIPGGRRARADYTWPGYVDALSSLLMVVIFVLAMFVVAQFYLSDALGTRDQALDRLNRQMAELASLLQLEQRSSADLRAMIATLSGELQKSTTERDRLQGQLSQSGDERDRLQGQILALGSERDRLQGQLSQAGSERERLQGQLSQLGSERDRLQAQITQLGAEQGKTLAELTEQQRLSAEAKATIDRLSANIAALQAELARLNEALDASEAKAREQNAQIVDLSQRLNRALVSKVEELARYRSEFFGRLREILGNRTDVVVVGDRFVFQSEVLFPSGSADLEPRGLIQIADVADALKEIGEKIPPEIDWILQVDGHTDTRPIRTPQFRSNWELSSARAIAVVEFLHSRGIPYERLAARGFAEFQPLETGTDAASLARNRRIELKITTR